MRKSLALTIISAILFSALVTSCTLSPALESTPKTPPQVPQPGFFLTVTQPADNSIINADKLEVRGHTTPGAVVSVNGEMAVADTEGIFAVTLTLEEGPNIIEVIASDEEGNEARTSLTVTLVKGG